MVGLAGTDGPGDVIRIHAYHAWANARVFAHLRTLPPGTGEREVAGVFPSVRHVLAHVLAADALWLDVMAGLPTEEVRVRATAEGAAVAGAGMAGLEARFLDLAARYRELLGERGAAGRPVLAVHPGGARLETTVAELVRHVCNHGTYHRGHVSAMLHQLGYRGAPTDYVLFLMESSGVAP
jgi:uncharacterized damage-inducible protein DinB